MSTPENPEGYGRVYMNCEGVSNSAPKGSNGCENNTGGRETRMGTKSVFLTTNCPRHEAEAKDAQEKEDDVDGGGGKGDGTVKVGA